MFVFRCVYFYAGQRCHLANTVRRSGDRGGLPYIWYIARSKYRQGPISPSIMRMRQALGMDHRRSGDQLSTQQNDYIYGGKTRRRDKAINMYIMKVPQSDPIRSQPISGTASEIYKNKKKSNKKSTYLRKKIKKKYGGSQSKRSVSGPSSAKN